MMKRCNCFVILSCVVPFCMTTAAFAQPGWYFSYGVGETDSDFTFEQVSQNVTQDDLDARSFVKEGDAKRIALGYNADATVSYEFGKMELNGVAEIKETVLPDGRVLSAVTDVEGNYAAAISKYSASDTITVTGRLGYYKWKMETTETIDGVSTVVSEQDNDFFYGLGMEIGWFGLEYDILDVGGEDIKYLGATLKYHF